MNTREKFGSYVLLKKLSEDALGETFRAGRFGDQGIEQVVLLRVFNAPGLNTAALWQQVSQRGSIQSGLLSPNLGHGVDFGELQGVPYVVYDYISGTNLASLMEQAERQYSPVPLDHALLIVERVALGLSAAYENRHQGSRILHGFLVPSLVMVSNEGEARLLGFEVSSGLRELAAQNPSLRSFERYVAPEALAGNPAEKSDDVYSLGVLLYELLTGQAFVPGAGGVPALLQQAQLANEGEALPGPIAQLLQGSLAPRESRISDSPAWHKTLSQLMIDQQYNPTTFNLAFFMHNLFRDEIEKESREIQEEKNLEDAGDTLQVAAPAVTATETEGAETLLVSHSEVAAATAPEEKSNKGLLGAIAALLALVALGGLGYWFFLRDQGAASEPPAAPVAAAPVEPEPVVPAGPSQEEIQAELERMRLEMAEALAAQSEEMKQTLAAQYEGKIKELQGQYDASQKAAAERRRKEQEAALAAQQAAIAAEAQRQAQATKPPAAPPSGASAQDPKTSTNPKQAAAGSGPADSAAQRPATTSASKEPAPPAVAKVETAPPPPPKPTVRPGQLVEPGPGVVSPKLLKQATARYPPMARRVRREATVIIRVLVDETGRVIKTETLGKKVGLGIDEAALDAAKDSRFKPATKDGVPVKMWHSLRFDFRP